jgi:hypothetical protein
MRRKVQLAASAPLLIALTMAWPGGALAVNGGACNAAYAPTVIPADFRTAGGAPNPIDNPYFPLAVGSTWRYEGFKEDASLSDVMTVTPNTRTIMGVTVTVVQDTAFSDGILAEDTFDWYAQDDAGNVWYFGEDTREYDEQGNVISTEGSWEAGVGNNLPGVLMEAGPKAGDTYRQEYAPEVAVDMATVINVNKHLTVPFDSFDNAVETKEYSCLEMGLDHKFYGAGVGLIREHAVAGGAEEINLVSFTP